MNEITINVKNISKRFGTFTAVNQISFTVSRGEIFGLLGPNGSGKTTTIRMMLGLMQPNEGDIEVLGKSIRQQARAIRPWIGYMSQHFSLYNDLSVLENLRFYGRSYGLSNQALQKCIRKSLNLAGLNGKEHNLTRELSGGWRQRLALGAAILHQPEILFLDEPTAGVDPVSRRAFWDLLYQLTSTGITVFVTTHYMDEAEHCHRLGFLQNGKLIAYGSPESIKEEKMGGDVLEILTPQTSEAIDILRNCKESNEIDLSDISMYGRYIHVVAKNIAENQHKIHNSLTNNNIEVDQLSIIQPSLEDVFIACMK